MTAAETANSSSDLVEANGRLLTPLPAFAMPRTHGDPNSAIPGLDPIVERIPPLAPASGLPA